MLLTAELAAQSSLTAKLQMQLLEKNAEINKLASTQQDVVRKVKEARSKRKMHGPTNKAEVVAFLAEVATDIDSAREATPNNGQQLALTKAEQILSQGKVELEQGDFDKAWRELAEKLHGFAGHQCAIGKECDEETIALGKRIDLTEILA